MVGFGTKTDNNRHRTYVYTIKVNKCCLSYITVTFVYECLFKYNTKYVLLLFVNDLQHFTQDVLTTVYVVYKNVRCKLC